MANSLSFIPALSSNRKDTEDKITKRPPLREFSGARSRKRSHCYRMPAFGLGGIVGPIRGDDMGVGGPAREPSAFLVIVPWWPEAPSLFQSSWAHDTIARHTMKKIVFIDSHTPSGKTKREGKGDTTSLIFPYGDPSYFIHLEPGTRIRVSR